MNIYLPIVPILGWWIVALSYQWRTQPDYSFGWINLVLTILIISKISESLTRDDRAQPPPVFLPALFALTGAPIILLAELYGNGVARSPVYAFTLSIGTILFLLAWGVYHFKLKTIKLFIFPLLFFLLSVPVPKLIWNPIVMGLQSMITETNIEILQGLGIPARQAGSLIIFQNTTVGVDEACSGVRSLQAMTMSAMFLGFFYFQSNPVRILVTIVGVIAALFGNFLRSLTLCLLSYHGGDELFHTWHDAIGWITMIVTLASLAGAVFLFTRTGLISKNSVATA